MKYCAEAPSSQVLPQVAEAEMSAHQQDSVNVISDDVNERLVALITAF